MNRIIEDFRRDDERILDRLVDGELTEEDRKSLLAALDDEPGSWRRCALAFLESQSLRGDLRAIREEAQKQPEVTTPRVVPAPRPGPPSRFFELCLAVAACVVLTLGFGVWWRSTPNAPGGPSRRIDNFAKNSPVPNTLMPRAVPVGHVKLNYDDPSTQGPDYIDLPVREVENLTEDHLRQSLSALPENVRQSLERSGHRVIQRQQWVPIPLKDGRHLLVPVEQVDVEPKNRASY